MRLSSIPVLRICFSLSALLSAILLFSPIVWMEIGPAGKAYYGPNVPDIYIYGGAITGKDLAFTPILLLMLFQFGVILTSAILSISVVFYPFHPKKAKTITWIICVFLALFPWWISSYNDIVICNSDGAGSDLTVHWSWGLLIYVLICIINAGMLILQYGIRSQSGSSSSKRS